MKILVCHTLGSVCHRPREIVGEGATEALASNAALASEAVPSTAALMADLTVAQRNHQGFAFAAAVVAGDGDLRKARWCEHRCLISVKPCTCFA